MGREHVGHGEIASFAQERVNLPKDKADEYRAQARKRAEAENGTWSLSEAAKYIYCDPMTLPTLIQQGLIEVVEVPTGKRVTEKSVKDFDARFFSLARLAKSNGTSSRSLQALCMSHNIPLEIFQRGYGKVGQPFARREYYNLLSESQARSKGISS